MRQRRACSAAVIGEAGGQQMGKACFGERHLMCPDVGGESVIGGG